MAGAEQSSLDALLQGVRRGAPEAFRLLHTQIADALHSFASQIVGPGPAAEDAVQQAFLDLVKNGASIRGDGRSLQAWMYRSVRYRCLDELRRRRRRPETLVAEVPDSLILSEPDGDPELVAALAQLTSRQRTVLFLRHVAGLSGHETARVMRTTRAGVFAAATRAERRLRDLLGDGYER